MQPNSYQPPSQPTQPQYQNDPFAFLNEQPKKKTMPGFSGGSTMKRIIVVVVGLIVLIILVIVVKALLSGNNGVNMTSLNAVLGEEEEIANLANSGIQNTTSQSYLNFSYTALGSVNTDQSNMLKLLSTNGIKTDSKNFILQPTADAKLSQSLQTNSYESVYGPVMQGQLELYESDLRAAYADNTSTLLKSYLSNDYTNTQLLLKMLAGSSG